MEKLVNYLKGEIERLKEYNASFDSKSWGYEEGILITGNEAILIIKACKGNPKSESIKQKECKCKELNAVNRICQKCKGVVPIRPYQ